MPTNLYGPNDNYDLEKSHVLPALIRKMHIGKCLENNDWDALRSDLNKRPIEGVSGINSNDEILQILGQYGITTSNEQKTKNKIVTVTLWGSGNVFREFLHVDDMADACVHIMNDVSADKLYNQLKQTHINIGTGIDLKINELASLIKNLVGFKGKIFWDTNKPDGTYKKQLDTTILNQTNWHPKIQLIDGVSNVYNRYNSKSD